MVATYLHGPVLARNPDLADHLLSQVTGPLAPLDDEPVRRLRDERLRRPTGSGRAAAGSGCDGPAPAEPARRPPGQVQRFRIVPMPSIQVSRT